jgi:polygalacturonase
MRDPNPRFFSRRNWLGVAPAGLAASAASGVWAGDYSSASANAPGVSEHSGGARTYNVRDFGAKGDGKALDTAAVQAAIDACSRDQGGTVLVPAGTFLIGTVEMRSNVTLRIAAQGKLLGSADGSQYHPARRIPLSGDTTLDDGNVALIFAVNARNITIEGTGTIDGQGSEFRSHRTGELPPSGRAGNDRPYHLLLYRCEHVRLRDVFLLDSAYHSVRIIESTFVWADRIRIYNRVNFNNDGFHFISSQYVHVSNCDVQSQDDACALFGSCRNVTVTNSTFSTRWAVFRFGGGNPENIVISNCIIHETYGCPIKMQFDPRSQAQNILFSNLIMQDVTGPISIDLDNRMPDDIGPAEAAPKGFVRNIMFNGVRARVVAEGGHFPDMPFEHHYNPGETRQCIVLNCVQNSFLQDVVLNDVYVTYQGGGTAAEAVREVPQIAGEYFEIGTPPAYGLYARRVRGLTLNNVRFQLEQPDLRPAIVLDRVSDAAMNGLTVHGSKHAASVLRFINTQEVLLSAARLLTPAAVFLRVEGSSSDAIIIDGGSLSRAGSPVAFEAGASPAAVHLRDGSATTAPREDPARRERSPSR